MKNMKDLKTLLEHRVNQGLIALPNWADFVVIDTENNEISFHQESKIKENKTYFGEATESVLKLKPLQSFEDSINVYVRIK